MSIKGLEQAIANLNSLDRNMVPNASAWAVNRVAANGVSVAVRRVAKETVAGDNRVSGIPVKLVRQRVRINKASASGHSAARIKVNRGNLPAIKLGAAQVRATNRKGPLVRKSSVLRIGRYVFRDAFIQRGERPLARHEAHCRKKSLSHRRGQNPIVRAPHYCFRSREETHA